jgi:hypothetical protein
MKLIKTILLTSLLSASVAYADDNCEDTTHYPTVPTQCSCVINNAITDCEAKSPIKSICNPTSLGNFFKNEPQGAQAQCEKYGGEPTQCAWSVSFYDKNC